MAIARWGEDRWILELVRVYAKLDGTTPVKRRSQIVRAFNMGLHVGDCDFAVGGGGVQVGNFPNFNFSHPLFCA
ncbi:MAG: hypothetical protein LH679_07925 [Cyanobacteria bacterium CAN_BIN43]|nr:hypothetical protein [Cyanobacteria bacterium CAN_BIN43]